MAEDLGEKGFRIYLLAEALDDRVKTIDVKGKVYHIPSDKDDRIVYTVKWSELLSRYTCACPDWTFRRLDDGTDCKHIKRVLNGEFD